MCYVESVEEQKYLAGMRKEKQAFERLIREKGVSGSLSDLFDWPLADSFEPNAPRK